MVWYSLILRENVSSRLYDGLGVAILVEYIWLHNIGETRTVQNFNQVFGDKPKKLGLVATLYPDLAINILTEALQNIFYNKEKKANSFQPINAMAVEWTIDVNYIQKIYIVEDVTVTDPGLNKAPVRLVLEKKYYDKNDTFDRLVA